MTWCACRVFLFLCCSFLVNFTILSWNFFNINNINILSRIVLLALFFCFFFCFCLVPGVGVGCISIHENDRGLRQHTINYICTSLL